MTADFGAAHNESRREAGCPKRMRHGPCGGARSDGSCEIPGVRCPFLERADLVRPDGAAREPRPVDVPTVLVDFRPDPTLDWELQEAAAALLEAGVGVLVGEHIDDVTPHRPSVVAAAIVATGLPTITTLTCRDRTLAQARSELEALVGLDGVVVHCVTGDHPAARLGLDTPSLFALDSIELVGVAVNEGAVVSVAESPAAAPAAWRPERLLDKQHAGASMAILNHAGNPEALVEFADRCTDRGVEMPLVAPVPVITDHRSADALARFPGLILPDGLGDRILQAADPEAAGIDAATDIAESLLGSGRFAGVNLSGSARAGGIVSRSRVMARIADRVAS